MARAVLMVGEGPTDRSFLISLLQNQYGFSAIEHNKYQYIFEKDGCYWIVPFPPNVSTKTGYGRLTDAETFEGIRALVASHRYIIGNDCDVSYLLLRDGDCCSPETRKEKIDEVEMAAKRVLKTNYLIHLPHGELENWYFAGLNNEFPHFSATKAELKKHFGYDAETMVDAKEKFKSILSEEMQREDTLIAAEVGLHFDIDLARKQSATFDEMILALSELNLL